MVHIKQPITAPNTKIDQIGNAYKSMNSKKSQSKKDFRRLFVSGSAPIWKSRLSWRIASVVFLTILIIQVATFILTVQAEEQKQYKQIEEIARSAITPVLLTAPGLLESPITQKQANRLISTTLVNGLSIYSTDLHLLAQYGETIATMMLSLDNVNKSYSSPDGSSYEFVLRPNDLRKPYIIIARINSENINPSIINYAKQSIMVMLLLSALVTTVLMIALGYWLLEPILFLRNNLLSAQSNPDNPKISPSPFNPNDEVGETIAVAQSLIKQNSENMQQIRSAAEDKIHKLAYYDQLTGLPNRTLFVQKLTELAYENKDAAKKIAVVTLDLDHFKDINDSMGHNVGDAILRGVSKRLRTSLPEYMIVSRNDADEFAVTCVLSSGNTARDVGEKIANIIREEPFKVYNENFQIRSSIGVATYPDDGDDPNNVLKNADIALNRAKEEGRDKVKEYSEDFDKLIQSRFQMLRDLRDALEKEELTVFYQPQFDLKAGTIIGAEALIRWWKKDNSKDGGHYISPGEFIPIAEQSGLIVPIGEWVMREACETAKTWHEQGKDIRIAVNVSGAQFFQSDLVAHTKEVLRDTGVKPQLLELEVTESVFMDDISVAVNTLKELHKLGVEIAIDDFGTGYSSLAYLRQFNIDRLKIDQSFIFNALNNSDDAAIAKTIINLGHSLNLKVIAEGVETKDHEAFLIAEGCDEVQGFRYSKPVPKDEFWAFVSGYNDKLDSFDS